MVADPSHAVLETERTAPFEPAERRGMLLITAGGEVGRALPIGPSPVTFGRAETCTVVLDDPSLSRVHAEVLRLPEGYAVRDRGSRNGTFVDGERVDFVAYLSDGARIQLGSDTQLRFSLVDDAEERGLRAMHEATRRQKALLHAAAPAREAPLGEEGAASRDPVMRALHHQALRAAQSRVSVLLLGETGVGKEVLARAIHLASPRAGKPFLTLHCAALAESLLVAELFGHEKGAFTGATHARPGLFESADGGTVFLDEVGELPPALQVKLLRVLEDRKVLRIGAREPRELDVRFIAATNRDLEAEAASGRFRRDLFFRLNGLSLATPPLRERPGELRELGMLFAARASKDLGRAEAPALSEPFLVALGRHSWPGNIRELRNVMERAVVLATGAVLLLEHLPAGLGASDDGPRLDPPVDRRARGRSAEPEPSDSLRDELGTVEKQRILAALERCQGNQTHAAELLGMPRRTLVTRLREWGLTRPRRKPGA